MAIDYLPSAVAGLTDDERALIKYHLDRLTHFAAANRTAIAYYEGRKRIRQLGIAIPPSMSDLHAVVGWPGTAVDVLDERLDWLGWATGNSDPLDLGSIAAANFLTVDVSSALLDALVCGIGFVVVGSGFDGEPHPLVTVESPLRVTGEWDRRARRLSSALSVDDADAYGFASRVTLYLPDVNVTVARGSSAGSWAVVDRDEHRLGRVLVAALPNHARAGRQTGRSEITRALRSYTDQAVRTLLGMEVHREFYQAPQRYALGVDEGAFRKADGTVATGWETVMGRVLALPRDEDGEIPEVGQFTAASPQPYLEQIRGLAELVASEAGIPASYLGFVTENPASADAIRAAEARLIKRAERRQATFGRGLSEVGALALLVRDGRIPDEYRAVGNRWRDAGSPTRAADADMAAKLVAAGVLEPTSQVTLDRLGFTPEEQAILRDEARRREAQARITALSAAAERARQNPAITAAEADEAQE